MDEIESKFHEQNYHLAQTNQDLNDQKLTATQIRLLAEESERALDEQRRQISIKNDELHTLEQANYRLEQKLSIKNFIKIFIIYFNFYLLFSWYPRVE